LFDGKFDIGLILCSRSLTATYNINKPCQTDALISVLLRD